jgi:RsiW-degrading membrane proteinase PrsW (M82 family)
VTDILKVPISLVPVLLFLTGLLFLDSYKLVRPGKILQAILVGILAALLCLLINSRLAEVLELARTEYARYIAPVIEEWAKGFYLFLLIRLRRVGFQVDAAICGFAIGTGFALAENIYYLSIVREGSILLWLVRGIGTAVLHGGTMALFGIVTKHLVERYESYNFLVFFPGFFSAVFLHMLFNLFVVPNSLLTTALLLVFFPLLIFATFERSERSLRRWLGVGFDGDVELLEMITKGEIAQTRIGRYLDSLMHSFPGDKVADMLCYLRMYLELAVRAKGILIMRQAGFSAAPEPEIKDKFTELEYLESSIGKAGKLAILPLLRLSNQDLWQIHMLK